MRSNSNIPFLLGLSLLPERVSSWDDYPFNLPFARDFRLDFASRVTFFVGENGCGKSTILEAIADICRLPVWGGGRTELSNDPRIEDPRSPFARALRPTFRDRPWDGYFVRAENLIRLADLLEQRERDPDFSGNPYFAYGGRSLHERSHGEAFLAIFENRLQSGGVILMDEPEAALSPQRQLTLLAQLYAFAQTKNTQIFIATHSPILLTFPGAQILSIDEDGIAPTTLEETSHFQITQGILECPERYWRHLREVLGE